MTTTAAMMIPNTPFHEQRVASKADELTSLLRNVTKKPTCPGEDDASIANNNRKKWMLLLVLMSTIVAALVVRVRIDHNNRHDFTTSDKTVDLLSLSQKKPSSHSLLEQLDHDMDGHVLFPHNNNNNKKQFEQAAEIWNQCTQPPMAVVECRTERDVQRAVPVLAHIQEVYDIPFRIKSGGHMYTGWSGIADGIILSVQRLHQVHLHHQEQHTGVATVGPGATVQEVLQVALPQGFGGVVGFCPGVAEGGYNLSGGVGVQSRLHGLGLDNVLGLRMVNAQGQVLVASADENTDLFFALRGAGNGNFGVVTHLEIQLHPIAEHNRGKELLSFEAAVSLQHWADFCFRLGSMDVPAGFFPLFEGGIVPDPTTQEDALPVAFLYTGDDLQEGKEYLKNTIVPMLAAVVGADVEPAYDMQVLSWYDWTVASGNFEGNYVQAWTGFLHADKNTPHVWQGIQEVFVRLLTASPYLMCDVELFGGAIATAARPDETAFPYRSAIWNVGLLLLVPTDMDNAEQVFEQTVEMINAEWPKVKQHLDGVYNNYPMASLSAEEYAKEYFGSNLERLMQLKGKYDPQNVFRHPQSIPLPK